MLDLLNQFDITNPVDRLIMADLLEEEGRTAEAENARMTERPVAYTKTGLLCISEVGVLEQRPKKEITQRITKYALCTDNQVYFPRSHMFTSVLSSLVNPFTSRTILNYLRGRLQGYNLGGYMKNNTWYADFNIYTTEDLPIAIDE